MLATLLLAGIVAAPVSSVALFVPGGWRGRAAGAWAATRRFVLALVGTAVVGAAVAVTLTLLDLPRVNVVAGTVGFAIASLVWLPATRRWNARAHLCWASSVFLFVAYLVFTWTGRCAAGSAR